MGCVVDEEDDDDGADDDDEPVVSVPALVVALLLLLLLLLGTATDGLVTLPLLAGFVAFLRKNDMLVEGGSYEGGRATFIRSAN